MRDELDEVAQQLSHMVAQTNIAQAVHGAIAAYDHCALVAMQVILEKSDGLTFTEIAEGAWRMADAMMVERKKRGFGSLDGLGVPSGSSETAETPT